MHICLLELFMYVFTGVVHVLEWFCLTTLILVSIAIDYLMHLL